MAQIFVFSTASVHLRAVFLRFVKLNGCGMTAFVDLGIKLAYKLKNPNNS